MNIIECPEVTRIKKHDLIPTVIDHIFTICKEDKNFNVKENINNVDEKLVFVNKKISKQNSLIEQSNTIKNDLLVKIKKLDDESFRIKYKILESLGSEL
mgnify:CR=1 FL=1